jgi:hypothetical protein
VKPSLSPNDQYWALALDVPSLDAGVSVSAEYQAETIASQAIPWNAIREPGETGSDAIPLMFCFVKVVPILGREFA